MLNSLTTQVGLKFGPIVLETFFKHYLERKSDTPTRDGDGPEHKTNLKHDELLWQESFEIFKSFLHQATKHTVEELQEFSNVRIPVPHWIWVKQVLVPMTSCDVAAAHLIKALGGQDATSRIVGGTKWWQVRGLRGVGCQWICQKSHIREARKRKREKTNSSKEDGPRRSHSRTRFPSFRKFSNSWKNSRPVDHDDIQTTPAGESQNFDGPEDEKEISIAAMDGTRCLLYVHGGGYYFGSIDQERYCMQRYARKINGRVFACNYRLAPQYPFPCAIQDILAAYLYLIDPPAEASHAAVSPDLIVIGGDSAGGGLCLAVLQVMRDSGIPLPAGAVLISPWCDLTHSFPSIIQNTDTDILPRYGLSLHKPSVLWPPPPDEMSSKVREGLRTRFQKLIAKNIFSGESPSSRTQVLSQVEQTTQSALAQVETSPNSSIGERIRHENADTSRQNISEVSGHTKEDHMSEVSTVVGRPPLPWNSSDNIHLGLDDKVVTINTQIQLYCPNNLLMHPLVSPVRAYLGGLPPLLVIAGDNEVLRDEVIYTAHKAAHPDRYPISEDTIELYPALRGIGDKHGPTSVHLQVYDGASHVLPLFSFTNPARYCYRAIATFIKHRTTPTKSTEPILPSIVQTATPESEDAHSVNPENITLSSSPDPPTPSPPRRHNTPSAIQRVSSVLRIHPSLDRRNSIEGTGGHVIFNESPKDAFSSTRRDSGDFTSSRLEQADNGSVFPNTAGEPSVYYSASQDLPLGNIMIRERVSTQGIIRPLEPESELGAMRLEPDRVGKVNEAAARRYLEGHVKWEKRFVKTAEKIQKQRGKNLNLAKAETIHIVKTMAQYQEQLFREQDRPDSDQVSTEKRAHSAVSFFRFQRAPGYAERRTWGWAWALDGERPPRSSIVSRRDTVEARDLARIADMSVGQEESRTSGNMLWSVLANFLTAQSHKHNKEDEEEEAEEEVKHSDEGTGKTSSGLLQRMKSLGGGGKKARP